MDGLNIAVISINAKLTERALREVAQSDMSSIAKRRRDCVRMADGTIYRAVYPACYPQRLNGYRFDQLILVDDDKERNYTHKEWLAVYGNMYETVDEIKQYRLSPLFDGLDAQVQNYIW